MRRTALDVYAAPLSHSPFSCETHDGGEAIRQGRLAAGDVAFPIEDGIVDFTAQGIDGTDASARIAYDVAAGARYEAAMEWLWAAFLQDEEAVRGHIHRRLDVRSGQTVLEVGCGSGSDSMRIARAIGDGNLYLQDISRGMLEECRRRLRADDMPARIEYSVSAAAPLPFADGKFDRVFHFGGLNTFGDIGGALAEMARVTKIGGRVVVGDESVAPWLRDCEFGRIVITNNPLYRAQAPLQLLPIGARDVQLEYIVNGTFYLISFTVGQGAPPLNLDLPHKGRRGGTLRSRYYGQLEGVSPEAKEMAIRAAEARGISLHQWLDDLVRSQARHEAEPSRRTHLPPG
jgi:SAM-dependent methyltransferase